MNEIATLIIGIILGIGFVLLWLAYKIKTVLNNLDQYIDRAIDDALMGIRVEKHGDVYRFYRVKDDQFVLQTTTLDNIREVFREQFPTKTVYIDGGDPEAVLEIKQILSKNPL